MKNDLKKVVRLLNNCAKCFLKIRSRVVFCVRQPPPPHGKASHNKCFHTFLHNFYNIFALFSIINHISNFAIKNSICKVCTYCFLYMIIVDYFRLCTRALTTSTSHFLPASSFIMDIALS